MLSLQRFVGMIFYAETTNVKQRGTVKVDAARKRGGIKLVWLAWFTDSVALWERQDEAPYLLDDPPLASNSVSSPTGDYHQISSDPDPDTDDWDRLDTKTSHPDPNSFEVTDIDWGTINDEVDAAMQDSDEDEKSEKSEVNSDQDPDETHLSDSRFVFSN